MIGKRFGKQIVLSEEGRNAARQILWKVKCDCGRIRIVSGCALRFKKRPNLSCRYCMNKKHGYSVKKNEHYLYNLWHSVKTRCYNKNTKYFKDYGGRGILLYKDWNEFIPFKNYVEKYLGPRPKGYSLDRKNNDGNYEPGNIRWASSLEQQRNTRKFSKKG